MPTGGASAAMLNSKRRMSTASATTDSNSANWSPARQPRGLRAAPATACRLRGPCGATPVPPGPAAA